MMPPTIRGEIRLTADLASWEVSLAGGAMVHLAAHAYSQEGDAYVFVALADGSPPYEVILARIPVKLVTKIRGG